METAQQLAQRIREADFPDWRVSGTGSVVVFTPEPDEEEKDG